MDNIKIRLGHTDSVNSIDKQNFLDVELKNTSKLAHFTDIKTTIDQYEQFKTERESCNKYRLIITINPYCTNVLFNTFTEIVYAEGSSNYEALIDNESKADSVSYDEVYGLKEPNRIQMLMNTEYSRPGCANNSEDKNRRTITDENYVYHPGFDIFDNHILRNTSFKIINRLKNGKGTNDELFNTIGDKMRYQNGDAVEYRRRIKGIEGSSTEISRVMDKHVYDAENILSFIDGSSINANLTEENGWYGFINTSTIQSRDSKNDFEELNIGRVLNDRKSCEFIDMYPDRTLYSFNPKYNKYQHREEYNWEIILTYPYAKTSDYNVVKDNNCNGLIILSVTKEVSPSNEAIILFRSMTKHGLKPGDTVRLYYKDKGATNWMTYEKDFIVKNVGNLDNNEKDYYFYINDMDFIRLMKYRPGYENTYLDYYYLLTNNDYTITIEEYESLSDDKKGLFEAAYTLDNMLDDDLVVDDNREYRFARVVGSVPSSYYIRKFKKLPNFKYATQNFPTDGSMTIDEYINDNAKYPEDFPNDKKRGKMVLYDKEQYKLAFESTIYNDDSTQVVFTDTIDIDNLVDDRGCPITEIYTTIIKTNYGHELWYNGDGSDSRENETVEFSHCFGDISCGLEFSQRKGDKGNLDILEKKRKYGDVCLIYKDKYNYDKVYDDNITSDKDEFFGDIVDFNPNECIEKTLQPFMYRFNTYQRELGSIDVLTYHEIWSDDWDAMPDEPDNGHLIGKSGYGSFSVLEGEYSDEWIKNRHEGYYYQPHYRIPLREFGAIVQGQHFDININTIVPVQSDAIYLKITTIRRSGVDKGDIIYLFDDKNDKAYEFVVTYVENRVSFYVIPRVKEGNPWQKFNEQSGMNWLDVCNLSVPYIDDENPDKNREAQLFFRRKNEDIPSYAEKVGKNKYLWRNVLRVGDMNTQELPEYAYANDAFYVTNEINFFLKRQDPNGWNGLYCKEGFPNDIPGNIMKESNYIYKEEKEVIC